MDKERKSIFLGTYCEHVYFLDVLLHNSSFFLLLIIIYEVKTHLFLDIYKVFNKKIRHIPFNVWSALSMTNDKLHVLRVQWDRL